MSAALPTAQFDLDAISTSEPKPLVRAAERGALRFITCGSVDDGKSTLIGRILYESGAVFDDHLDALDRDSVRFGTAGRGRDYALLVDGLAAEREQGITIDVAYRYFATPKRSFIVADTPGHEQYTRNMATGASTADLAILLVDARKGLLPQTRRHAFIVSMVGVKHVVVAINKMDLVGFDEKRFRTIEADFRKAAEPLGFDSITCIPVSARDGDNLTTHSLRMPWFRGQPLLPLLESLEIDRRRGGVSGFAMPVQWVNRPDADFRGFAGTIAQGAVRPGDDVIAWPSGRASRIARIVTADGNLPIAYRGQAVTLVLVDEIDLSRGDVLATPAQGASNTLSRSTEIEAELIITGEANVKAGAEFLLKLGSALVQASVLHVDHAIDVESYRRIEAGSLRLNALGTVRLRLDRPLVHTSFATNPDLGGFILIDRQSNETSAFGFIRQTSEADPALRPNAKTVLKLMMPAVFSNRDQWITYAAWRGLSAVAIGAIVLGLSGTPLLAISAAIADLTIRPVARAAHDALWRRILSRKATGLSLDEARS